MDSPQLPQASRLANRAFMLSLICLILSFLQIFLGYEVAMIFVFPDRRAGFFDKYSNVISLALGAFSVFWLIACLVAFLMGIVALFRIIRAGVHSPDKAKAIAAVIVSPFSALILPFLFIPFLLPSDYEFNAHQGKQALEEVYNQQTKIKAATGRFAKSCAEIKLERKYPRFTLYLSAEEKCGLTCQGFLGCPVAGFFPLPSNFRPFVTDDKFLVVAVGNIDPAPNLEVWTVDEKGNFTEAAREVSFTQALKNRLNFSRFLFKSSLGGSSENPPTF
jgi:hypothetical protein